MFGIEAREVAEMKFSIKMCLLFGMILPAVAAYCYLYEAKSMGLLPVINYPLRPFAFPLFVAGFLFLFSSLVLYRFSSEAK